MERYQDKKGVIIGGTSGMGLATAKMLLGGGARVLVTGRSKGGLESAQKELVNPGTDGRFPERNAAIWRGTVAAGPHERTIASMSVFLWNQFLVRCIFELPHEGFVPQRPPGMHTLANSS
jgi:NAD(P)-dependent dehydrogenase (short-subunit alcohol dehydrogenase family)